MSTIQCCVSDFPSRWLTLDRLELLLAVAPTGEDLEAVAPYDGDPAMLATCEHFFFTVRDKSRVEGRGNAVNHKASIS